MFIQGRLTAFCLALFLQFLFIGEKLVQSESFSVYTVLFVFLLLGCAYFGGREYDKVLNEANTDMLTKVYNRRFILNTFPSLTKQCERIFVIIVDCDDFKKINDSYGHEMGDQVLITVAKALKKHVGELQYVARWGGDEFVILGKLNNDDQMERYIESIQEELRQSVKKLSIPLSVSIGYAIYPTDADTLCSLMKIADENMYGLKANNKKVSVS